MNCSLPGDRNSPSTKGRLHGDAKGKGVLSSLTEVYARESQDVNQRTSPSGSAATARSTAVLFRNQNPPPGALPACIEGASRTGHLTRCNIAIGCSSYMARRIRM